MTRVRLLAAASAAVILAGSGTAIARSVGRGPAHAPAIGIPSAEFWAHKLFPAQTLTGAAAAAADPDADSGADPDADGAGSMSPIGNVLYQGNTDERFLHLTSQAGKLGETGGAWKNIGPKGGVEDIAGVGSGAELLGKVGGIGTAMTVDPNDHSEIGRAHV